MIDPWTQASGSIPGQDNPAAPSAPRTPTPFPEPRAPGSDAPVGLADERATTTRGRSNSPVGSSSRETSEGHGYGIDVLAFGPHPDDVEIFCGGTLLRLAQLGYSTAVVDLTRGEAASRGTPEEREREAWAASKILGLRFRENLGFPDTGIESGQGAGSRNPDSQLSRVVATLRRHRPEIVLIPWREERHPDHVAASELLTRAVFFAGVGGFRTDPATGRFRPRQVLYYAMRYRMSPTFVMDTSTVAQLKREAILCYASQVSGRGAGAGDESLPSSDARHEPPTLIGSSRALDAIEARDRFYGSMIGVSHGEPLRMPNVPGLVDPVRHFRENPFTEAHAFEPMR